MGAVRKARMDQHFEWNPETIASYHTPPHAATRSPEVILANWQAELLAKPGGVPMTMAEKRLSVLIISAIQSMPRHRSDRINLYLDANATARADEGLLQKALLALVDNALDYSDGQITILLTQEKFFAHLYVTDQGRGIRLEHLVLVFKPYFYYAEKPRGGHGLGLGLYQAKKIVQHHGGLLRVRSKWNQGSTFHIILPLA